MKIDRRGFLSLGIGAAAGTALSPIPWKLADDSSIWTQMWPWTPVPEDGEVSFTNSTCTLCPGGCGITVRKVDDRAVKIEGRKNHPINDGGLCLLGLSGLQLLYGATRVKAPLKRVGERGENKWQRISWAEALSLVATKLSGIRKNDQAHMVGAISDSGFGTVPNLLKRFLAAYGSPNFMTRPSIEDSYRQALHLMQGGDALAGFDVEKSDHILSFGSGLLEGWGSPVRMFRANSTLRNAGGKMVQVESRMSRTAAKSDRWVPINPGTETALALGIAFVLIKGSLYNTSFVDQYTTGFEDWTDDKGQRQPGLKRLILEEYSLERVEKITGVKGDDIIARAEEFAGATSPLAICGAGQGRTPGSLNTFLAVQTLNALVGNINQKGGIWSVPQPDYIHWAQAQRDEVANTGNRQPRLDGAGGESYPITDSRLNRFFSAVAEGDGYPMQALLIAGSNPCYTLPDGATVKRAFEKIPFVVSFSSYMDETAQNSDLILPNHTYLERREDVPVMAGLQIPIMGLVEPVVKPLFGTRHTGDVILDIAKKIGGSVAASFPWRTYEFCLKRTLRSQWRALSRKGIAGDARYRPPAWESAFTTPSKKFEFTPLALQSSAGKGGDGLPLFAPVKISGDDSYPLTLVPFDNMRLANGSIGAPPFAIKTVSDDVLKGDDVFVEINPTTADGLGLQDGKMAQLSTPKGSAKVRIRYSEGIMPDVIALPRGLGHTAYDEFIAGKGVNVNDLIESVDDPITGLDAAWGIKAKLSRA